jgi:hypothetical protein
MRLVNPHVPAAICALAAILFALTPCAHADTYQLFNLGEDNGMSFLGLNSSGLAFFGGVSYPASYFTYFDGARIGTSATAPTFTVDNGTICAPTLPAGWQAFRAVCNNGRVAWTGTYGGNPPTGVYFTTNPTTPTVLPQLGGSGIWMNSIGDVIFDDAFQDNWWEAVDLNTLAPEPGSLVLLATGILALAITLRRRPHPPNLVRL